MVKKSKSIRNEPRLTATKLSKEIEADPGPFSGLSVNAFLLLDENLNLLSINDAGQKMFGVSKAGVFGKCILDVLPDIKNTGIYKKYRHVVKTGKSIAAHLELGGRHLSVQLFKQGDALGMIAADITERKRMEEEIQSLAKFPSGNPNPVLRVAKDGKVLYGNKAALELLAKWKTKIGEKVPGRWCRLIEEAFESGKPRFEEKVKDKIFLFEIGLLKESGYVNLYGHDITERKRMEEAVRESEERFRAIIESAPFGYYRVGKDGLWQYVNPEWERMHGLLLEEVVGKSFEITQPEDAVEQAGELVKRAFAGEIIVGEFSRLTKKGNIEYHIYNIQPVKHDKEIVAIEGFISDVTDRKRAEEALRNERNDMLNALNAMKDGVYIINQQNDILYTNPSAKEEFGPHEGKKCYEYFHDFNEPCHWCDSREVFAGKAVRSEWFSPKTDKTYEIVHTPFRETDGSMLKLSIIRDITERKRMEEALRKSEQTIRQLAKASTYAHEEERQRVSLEVHDRISQTLAAAFHQLQALEAIPIENTEAQQILKRASDLLQESIRESRSIMEDLYSPVLSDFGIVAVIDEELRRFREETACGTKFDKKFAVRPIPNVELTAYRIFREVIANIKRHAIGATEVRVSLSCEAGVVSLQVKDNGPGFDVEAALLNKRVGGLKGMQRRAELGGGTFEVVSSRGHGTTVTVCLPYSSET